MNKSNRFDFFLKTLPGAHKLERKVVFTEDLTGAVSSHFVSDLILTKSLHLPMSQMGNQRYKEFKTVTEPCFFSDCSTSRMSSPTITHFNIKSPIRVSKVKC